jgi:hypothetical protein
MTGVGLGARELEAVMAVRGGHDVIVSAGPS